MKLKWMPLSFCLFSLILTGSWLRADETREVKIAPLTLEVPASWKQQQPSNNLRLAQFSIGPAEGDTEPAELVISGPFGGSVAENVKRWVAQFQADGLEQKITQGESSQGKYIFAELSGTYLKPDGPPIQRKTSPTPGYKTASVMLMVPEKGNYFLKLTGPQKTVDEAIEGFRASFGGDVEKEEAFAF